MAEAWGFSQVIRVFDRCHFPEVFSFDSFISLFRSAALSSRPIFLFPSFLLIQFHNQQPWATQGFFHFCQISIVRIYPRNLWHFRLIFCLLAIFLRNENQKLFLIIERLPFIFIFHVGPVNLQDLMSWSFNGWFFHSSIRESVNFILEKYWKMGVSNQISKQDPTIKVWYFGI